MLKKLLVLLMILLFSLTLIACTSSSPEGEDNAIWAENLFANRNSYIGDNVADSDLLNVLAVSQNIGDYTLELQTETEPYALIIHFACEEKKPELIEKYAYVLLALIENVEKISWTFSDEATGELDVDTANANLSQNIKSFGKSKSTVEKLLLELDF